MRKSTILVIDEVGDCSTTATKSFELLNFDIMVATTEQEGRHILETTQPNLIISDCLVVPNPVMWVEEIHRLGLTTQVIAITGDLDFNSTMDWVALGVFNVLLHPLEPERLRKLTQAALEVKVIFEKFTTDHSTAPPSALSFLEDSQKSEEALDEKLLTEFYRGLIGHHDEDALQKQVTTSVKKLTGAQWAEVIFNPDEDSTLQLPDLNPTGTPNQNYPSESYTQMGYKLLDDHVGNHGGEIKLYFDNPTTSTQAGSSQSQKSVQMTEVISMVSLALHSVRQYAKAVELGNRDGLTDLYNQRTFHDLLEQEFAKSRRYKLNLSLLIFDLDHFKSVNDTFGHPIGDLVLKAIAQAMITATRSTDLSARIGGEEFAIILPHTSIEQALILTQRLKDSIANKVFNCNGTTFKQTISQGIVDIEYFLVESMEDMVYYADQALYLAKREGRNTVRQASEVQQASEVPINPVIKEGSSTIRQASQVPTNQ